MKKFVFILTVLLPFFFGCKDEIDHYKRPDWLTGSLYKIIGENENYSLFKEAIDRAEMKESVDGKVLMTLFVPNNAAMKEYLNTNGYNSVSDIPVQKLKDIVTSSIAIRSYNAHELATYHFDFISEWKNLYNHLSSMYAKAPYLETIEYEDPKRDVYMYNWNKMIPFYTDLYWEAAKVSDVKKSVDAIFGEGTYDGEYILGNGARFVEYDIVGDNGYMFEVDKVTDPLENLDIVLQSKPDYSIFKSMYDMFTQYEYQTVWNSYISSYGVDSVYSKSYDSDLWNLYDDFDQRWHKIQYYGGTIIVPTNEALTNYLDTEFGPGSAADLSSIPPITLKYILMQHSMNQQLWMSQIEDGTALTNWVDPFDFTVDNLVEAEIASNGTFYGINKVLTPSFFSTIMNPLLTDLDYSDFLYVIEQVQYSGVLSNKNSSLGLFIMNNEKFAELGFRISNKGLPILDERLQYLDGDEWKDVPGDQVNDFVDRHVILYDESIDFSGKGFVKNLNVFSLFKYQDDKLYVNESEISGEDELYSEILSFNDTHSNGATFMISNPLSAPQSDMYDIIANDGNFAEFENLLIAAEIIENEEITSSFLSIDNYILLAPTNDLITAGLADGSIPPLPLDSEDEETQNDKRAALFKYCSQYFVSMNENGLSNYLVPGDDVSRDYKTKAKSDSWSVTNPQRVTLHINSSSDILQITSEKGEMINTENEVSGMICRDGLVYKVDGIFSINE